jgi:hypothetical protein
MTAHQPGERVQQPACFPRSVSTAASVISGCNADFVLVCGSLSCGFERGRLLYNHCGVRGRPVLALVQR